MAARPDRRKKRKCMQCGCEIGFGEYVEFRVLDWIPEQVEDKRLKYTRWRSKTMYGRQMCPKCAIEAVERMMGKKEAV